MSLSLVVDPGAVESALDLFPRGGEYCVAMRGLFESPRAESLPDVVLLELYAYEFVERSREFVGEGGVWRVPFWPASLFVAADTPVHAGRELAVMLPAFDSIEWVERDAAATADAAIAVLGALRFDVAAYYDSVRELLGASR